MTIPLFAAGQEESTSDDYYTPSWVFESLAVEFDLDVAAPPGGVPWIPAKRFYTMADDGLAQPWEGRVWMNPPFSAADPWVRKFREHGDGVALVPGSKSYWFDDLWADPSVSFAKHRRFNFVGGDILMTVFFVAIGDECVDAITRIGNVR